MTARALLLLPLGLAACGQLSWREDPDDWYDQGTDTDVTEPIEFTDVNYDFPTDASQGIQALNDAVFPVDFWTAAYAEEDQFPQGTACQSYVESYLPVEVVGVVTVLPDYYFKTIGCESDDEKYYGSYFIQDATGALFILGDSKVAHFDMGDKIRVRIRGARTSYDLNMVAAHDVIEILERDVPIYYEVVTDDLGLEDVAKVKRVTGTVTTEPDTFGEFEVETDDGLEVAVSLDSELARRDITVEIGERVQVTGPVMFSYDVFSLVVMRVGQLERLAPAP